MPLKCLPFLHQTRGETSAGRPINPKLVSDGARHGSRRPEEGRAAHSCRLRPVTPRWRLIQACLLHRRWPKVSAHRCFLAADPGPDEVVVLLRELHFPVPVLIRAGSGNLVHRVRYCAGNHHAPRIFQKPLPGCRVQVLPPFMNRLLAHGSSPVSVRPVIPGRSCLMLDFIRSEGDVAPVFPSPIPRSRARHPDRQNLDH